MQRLEEAEPLQHPDCARMVVNALLERRRNDIHMAKLPRRNGEFDVYVQRERGLRRWRRRS